MSAIQDYIKRKNEAETEINQAINDVMKKYSDLIITDFQIEKFELTRVDSIAREFVYISTLKTEV